MLDLEKLEAQLDAALAKETPESLNQWLEAEAREEYLAYLEDVLYPQTPSASQIDVDLHAVFEINTFSNQRYISSITSETFNSISLEWDFDILNMSGLDESQLLKTTTTESNPATETTDNPIQYKSAA